MSSHEYGGKRPGSKLRLHFRSLFTSVLHGTVGPVTLQLLKALLRTHRLKQRVSLSKVILIPSLLVNGKNLICKHSYLAERKRSYPVCTDIWAPSFIAIVQIYLCPISH